MFNLNLYTRPNGRIPVQEFLDSLEKRMLAKALRELDILETYGSDLREPHVKYMSEGIYELRIKAGSDISRIFYFFFSGKGIVLTNGFIKKIQKTPKNELEKAIDYKKDYLDREGKNEL